MDYPGKVITKNQVTPTQTSATGVWTLDDAAAAIKNNNWPVAGVPNPISKSLRFNSADSANLTRTPSVNGNRQTWTWSAWIKRANPSQAGTIWGSNFASGGFGMAFGNYGGAGVEANRIGITLYAVGTVTTNAVFRDPSAWYHIVARFDSTQAAQADRFRLYVNNVQQTLSANLNVTQNANYHVNESGRLQTLGGESGYFNDLYMAEVNHIDGQSLTPSSFGMTDPQTGAWEPIKYTGTYGTNGFYLNFKDATSTTTLGYDYSGNGNNYTPNNFSVTAGAGNDSLTDVPTPWIAYNTTGDVGGVVRGNYCTWSAIDKASDCTLANGSLDVTTTNTPVNNQVRGTIGVSSGKWYWEILVNTTSDATILGIVDASVTANTGEFPGGTAITYGYYGNNGKKFNNNIDSAYGNTYGSGDVIGCALDLDNGKIWWSKNGTWQASGDPAAGTNAAYTGVSGTKQPAAGDGSSTSAINVTANFGQRPFAYTPPAGFLSLCTTNLPNPTIGTSTTTQAGKYMNVVLYTGNGATGQTITGVGFEPDFVWVKSRSNTQINGQYDRLRYSGSSYYYLASDTTNTELTGNFSALTSDGWTFNGATHNTSTYTYVGWAWKANGAGSSNTAGTITSTVSANTTSGFSIVSWAATGANATIGHGLGVAPSMIIMKNRDAATNWAVYHTSITAANYLRLNSTIASTAGSTYWQNTTATSTVFYTGTANDVAFNNMIAYCFAPIAGYSAFGSYTGNGSTDGPFVYLGFRPRYLLVKRTDTISSWMVVDSARDTYNMVTKGLYPNLSDAEGTGDDFDFLSNGFKLRDTGAGNNASGGTYIYAAFAEFPFKFANAR